MDSLCLLFVITLGWSNDGEAYKFDVQLPIIYSPRRIVIEYWEGKPFVSEPKHVRTDLLMNKEQRTGSEREPYDL